MKELLEYEQELEEAVEEWGEEAILIFRGQENQEWELESSAERRLEKSAHPTVLMTYLKKSLIDPARTEGYAHRSHKELNDLELLAALQHQGAATFLLDFTANFHVALSKRFKKLPPSGQKELLKIYFDRQKLTDQKHQRMSSEAMKNYH